MANGWTVAELRKIAERTGATFSGQNLEKPAQGKVKRNRKDEPTEADRQIAAEKRLRNHRKFETAWRQLGGPELKPEYKAVKGRRYQTDYVHEETKVSIELNGGTMSKKKTAHNSGVGIERDATKQNLVVLGGYTPFVLTAKMLAKKNIAANLMPIIEFIRERSK